MATIEQRVGQLEGTYAHLATKADLAELEMRLTRAIGDLEARLVTRIIMVQLGGYVAVGAIISAVVAVLRLV